MALGWSRDDNNIDSNRQRQSADHKQARYASTANSFQTDKTGRYRAFARHKKPDRDGEQPADQNGRRTTGQSAGATSSAAGPLSRVVRLNSTR